MEPSLHNSFGHLFRITTFGESHGPLIGVVIDGCPAGLLISEDEINEALQKRRPGFSPYTSPRKEKDEARIVSGVYEGHTTGAPITLLIDNLDANSSQYSALKDLYRPGHANFTYLHKYGIYDYRGGGRASARETAARVAAGAIAKKLLKQFSIDCTAFLHELDTITADIPGLNLKEKVQKSPLFCPDEVATSKMQKLLQETKDDSLGAILGCTVHAPLGLGEPVYQKTQALLASAMLSIPACVGFEIGHGFFAAQMRGSTHNEPFELVDGAPFTKTAILGGITTGSPLFFRVAFKPTSSIKKEQTTLTLSHKKVAFKLSEIARHDPCVAIRAVPVVEAMTALVLADLVLLNRSQVFSKSTLTPLHQ